MDLFNQNTKRMAPLAERMRPQNLSEVVGQRHLIGDNKILKNMLEGGALSSLIFWGPPGVGKTTLAKLFARHTNSSFVAVSAVSSGIKDLKVIAKEAHDRQRLYNKRTLLFIDEIHRFNKAQQDFLLPSVEQGTMTLIGATTENPSFEVISALLSRSKVLVLKPLSTDDLKAVLTRSLKDSKQGLGQYQLTIQPDALDFLAEAANGDMRSALNGLELASHFCNKSKKNAITIEIVSMAIQKKHLYYDKNAEEHYNVISAFIKSMRGSDPDAAVYWMCRMLAAGEDALFIARRMVIFASEDVGNGDPQALPLAIATMQAVDFVGLPEARIPLAQTATYLATAKKSNASYAALNKALEDVEKRGNLPVPMHLRNAPTKLMKSLGYSKGYQYAHNYKDAKVTHVHLPDALKGRKYYTPPQN